MTIILESIDTTTSISLVNKTLSSIITLNSNMDGFTIGEGIGDFKNKNHFLLSNTY